MRARDIMTRRVITIGPDDTVLQAVRLMLQNRISGLPVADGEGNLVGIVTEGDFLRRSETGTERKRSRWLEFLVGPGRLADDYVRSHGRKISEVMTPDPYTATEDTTLDDLVALMERHRVKRVPVVQGKRLVGIVSRANLLHALASLAHDAPPASADDTAIRERLLADLEKQPWAPLALINVVVRNGVVELAGAITNEKERKALIVAAENVPGVKSVRDRLAFIEPMSGMVIEQPEGEGAAKTG